MSSSSPKEGPPQDVVALFHASFHPTQGNIVDWSRKNDDELSLDGVEFCALPSGLHTVDQDVIYFTHGSCPGVCVFRRRKTTAHGQRGFRLSSFGVLLAPSVRPRPWLHVPALHALADEFYEASADEDVESLHEERWTSARAFFEAREVRHEDLGGAGQWNGWDEELDNEPSTSSTQPSPNPTMNLSHFLRLLGPSSLTIYKHILGRKRVLIYTPPPVERACMLCYAAADMCFEDQAGDAELTPEAARARLKGKQRAGVRVLGMVTLHDLEKLNQEAVGGRGFVACTTDALFLERPQYYDLIIDLTTTETAKGTRPMLSQSRRHLSAGARSPSFRLSTIRFTWSDVKLWSELERILQLDPECEPGHTCGAGPSVASSTATASSSRWTDAWRVYEDVCLLCAGFWMGLRTREWGGGVRLEGPDELDLSENVRRVGAGIEGGTVPRNRALRRASGMVIRRASVPGKAMSPVEESRTEDTAEGGQGEERTDGLEGETEGEAEGALEWVELQRRQALTTRALLQALHTNTSFLLGQLALCLPPAEERPSRVVLAPRELLAFELGPLSGLDARFLGWLAAEYGQGSSIAVKKGWREIVGLMFGVGS
ncbi:hypothetical protein OF83DRAFT_1168398 [Amylostereum chailletii]|nr:hypothetical protein OF83DRAFT_1168398 [Amylostereum chailletii]